ncbi:MAG: ribbon-helix-helix protein, CopG family [Rubrobacteridae bacterium]|nr:ribbon-helix-helix protein, CopG family [Rubrobacteridae bacterium]
MSKKVLISIPDELLSEIDNAAAEEHRTRSEFIREASRKYLVERHKTIRRPLDNPRIKAAIESLDRLGQNLGGWDSTDEIRSLRDKRSNIANDSNESNG